RCRKAPAMGRALNLRLHFRSPAEPGRFSFTSWAKTLPRWFIPAVTRRTSPATQKVIASMRSVTASQDANLDSPTCGSPGFDACFKIWRSKSTAKWKGDHERLLKGGDNHGNKKQIKTDGHADE